MLSRAIVPAVTADSFGCAAQVQNNHHHRVGPFEERLPFGVAMKHYPSSYLSDENLLPGARRMELSHHLAHAWCAVGTSPWPIGEAIHHDGSTLVVVMDGMGETYGAMRQGLDDSEAVRAAPGGSASAATEPRGSYITDLTVGPSATLPTVKNVEPSGSGGWREAESAYLVTGRDEDQSSDSSGSLGAVRPVWKRWTEERSPPALENHGFHDMESLGAHYSRVSSAVFGDWNACGKVRLQLEKSRVEWLPE